MSIFAIGDSHSIFFHNSPIIKEHWVSFAGLPLTWFRLIKEELDIYNIGNKLGNGHEKYNIKTGDFVLFCYGWNDIQKNINKYAKDDWETELEKLITNYIILLKNYEKKYNITSIVLCMYPNPLKISKDINGSNDERTKYIKYTNIQLLNKCKEYNLKFFDIYDMITGEKGFIKQEYTKDGIHLDYNNSYLRDTIDEKLLLLCK